MTNSFEAQILSVETSDDILIVGLAENDLFSNYIVLQYQETLTDHDRNLGMTKYYLEVGPGGDGAYNCINSVLFSKTLMRIILNSSGVAKFDCNELIISYEFDDNDLLKLRTSLAKIFATEPNVNFTAQ